MIIHKAQVNVFQEIMDTINHSHEQGLPLASIELTEIEWSKLISSAEMSSYLTKPARDLANRTGSVMIHGIKVWKTTI